MISGPVTSPISPQESTALSTLGRLSRADLRALLEYCGCIKSPEMLGSLHHIQALLNIHLFVHRFIFPSKAKTDSTQTN
jgi:hypothetical protein